MGCPGRPRTWPLGSTACSWPRWGHPPWGSASRRQSPPQNTRWSWRDNGKIEPFKQGNWNISRASLEKDPDLEVPSPATVSWDIRFMLAVIRGGFLPAGKKSVETKQMAEIFFFVEIAFVIFTRSSRLCFCFADMLDGTLLFWVFCTFDKWHWKINPPKNKITGQYAIFY